MNVKRPLLIVAAGLMTLIAGCGSNEEVARVATQAADRQAQQNDELARLNREVASGTKNLVDYSHEGPSRSVFLGKQLTARYYPPRIYIHTCIPS